MSDVTLDYEPQPRQALAHSAAAHQIFYGGAVGGGKSHFLRWELIIRCLQYPGCQTYLFRRSLPELEDNHIRPLKDDIPRELGSYSQLRGRFEFTNSSAINCCYCEKDDDVYRRHGAEMHILAIDEAAHLTPFQINYLRGRVRLGRWMPEGYTGPTDAKFRGIFPRILMGSNPGGPGHNFLKRIFIDPSPVEMVFGDASMLDPTDPGDKPWPTIYIPAKIRDNKYIGRGYAGQFRSLGNELYKALTEGDWDAVVGQAVHNLSREKHMIRQHTPPRECAKIMSIDWGSSKPFSVGWYYVSDGRILKGVQGRPDVWLPSGAVIRYDEWYGSNSDDNKGLRLPGQAVAREIIKRETKRNDVMDYRVADNEMWAQHGGPSTYTRFVETDGRFAGMRKAIKDRKRNYSELLSRLAGNEYFMEDGEAYDHPMFFITDNCRQFWRTVPTLILDDIDPEKGPETKKQEDHIYDEVVYLLRSRPFVITKQDRYEESIRPFMKAMKPVDPYATS